MELAPRIGQTALFLVSFLALVVNIAVFVYHFAEVLKYKRNLAVGVHSDLGEYQALAAERWLAHRQYTRTRLWVCGYQRGEA